MTRKTFVFSSAFFEEGHFFSAFLSHQQSPPAASRKRFLALIVLLTASLHKRLLERALLILRERIGFLSATSTPGVHKQNQDERCNLAPDGDPVDDVVALPRVHRLDARLAAPRL